MNKSTKTRTFGSAVCSLIDIVVISHLHKELAEAQLLADAANKRVAEIQAHIDVLKSTS